MNSPSPLLERWLVGFERLFGGEAINFGYVLAAYGVLTVVELMIPAQRAQSWSGRFRNLAYAGIYIPVGLGALALWYTLSPAESGAPQTRIENVLLLPGYLFVGDLAYYWYHRAQHRFRALWALHELHHADTELNVTTSYRTYWLEAPVQSILVASPVLVIFGSLDPTLGVSAMVTTRFVLLFAHCNFRLPLGPLTPVICGPQWHRIHHSILPEHAGKNLAQLFPVIDWLFGTYYAPERGEYPPTGTDGLRSDESIWRAQVHPFLIWRDEIATMRNRGHSTRMD